MARTAERHWSNVFGSCALIVVTVGTMLPFDRLVRAADLWARDHAKEEVIVVINDRGRYQPQYMRPIRQLKPDGFSALVAESRLIIAHAGTGSYLLAAENARAIVMLPRQAALKEHNSDHQIYTANWLRSKRGVYIAMNEEELPTAIATALSRPDMTVEPVPPFATDPLISNLRNLLIHL